MVCTPHPILFRW